MGPTMACLWLARWSLLLRSWVCFCFCKRISSPGSPPGLSKASITRWESSTSCFCYKASTMSITHPAKLAGQLRYAVLEKGSRMIEPLSEAQQRWVEATFATLRTEDKVAQLLIPTLGAYDYRREAVDAFLTDRTLGGIFVGIADRDRHRAEIAQLQARCSIPLVVA